jgi:succinate dehydrogenase / fumarate reductase cytochrome b subunit
VDLPLHKLRLPISGIVSIVHRVTGVALVLLIPVALYLLEQSLRGPAEFERVRQLLASAPSRFGLALVALMLVQHFFSGLRHLLLDLNIGVARSAARRSAWLTLIASAVVLTLSLYGALA